jgi:hypothetical protein
LSVRRLIVRWICEISKERSFILEVKYFKLDELRSLKRSKILSCHHDASKEAPFGKMKVIQRGVRLKTKDVMIQGWSC